MCTEQFAHIKSVEEYVESDVHEEFMNGPEAKLSLELVLNLYVPSTDEFETTILPSPDMVLLRVDH